MKKTSPKERYYISQTNNGEEKRPFAIFVYRAVKHETGIYYVSFSLPMQKNANYNYGNDLSFSRRQYFSGDFKNFEKHDIVRFSKRISQSEYIKHWNRAKKRMLTQIKKKTDLESVEKLRFAR